MTIIGTLVTAGLVTCLAHVSPVFHHLRNYNNRHNTMTKEEAIRRFKAAKQTKKDAVAALEQKMKQAYEERTGLKANYVVTL